MNPSFFSNKYPWDCAANFDKSEHETIAQNIMVILARTGDEFRELTFEEYKTERLKDKNFSDREEKYFNEAIKFCKSADTAKCFSKSWNF